MNIAPGHAQAIPAAGNRPRQFHLFDADSIDAIDAALAAQRPLLLRGEPGIGKSQLARAAALVLRRAYVQQVVDARTESSDLLWSYDAVARLAEAQLQGAFKDAPARLRRDPRRELRRDLRKRLAVRAYVAPGPLWWAFDWADALAQAQTAGTADPVLPDAGDPARRADPARRCDPANGCVVLIDELDKAESDVPNGLLEALGAGQFRPLGSERDVVATGPAPLVIITTNEERALPDAFLRRCMVLHMRLPSAKDAPAAFKQVLVERGRAHFGAPGAVAGAVAGPVAGPVAGEDDDETLLGAAAALLIADRVAAEQARRTPLPGQAEYLDLVRAVLCLAGEDRAAQAAVLKRIAAFALKKHPDAIGAG